jgi:hypothetical protein
MYVPNFEHSTRLAPRSSLDRRAIGLVGDLLLIGVWMERRFTKALTPRHDTQEASSLRVPPGIAVLRGVMQLAPLRRVAA